ncbi:DNA-binding protein P3A2-like [Sycon ciliatum]|uniref:DNA-binding protein P3A2-like n=1 Tax=Sycon ciliatum TaxID=27933 RepID=UPI0031F62451
MMSESVAVQHSSFMECADSALPTTTVMASAMATAGLAAAGISTGNSVRIPISTSAITTIGAASADSAPRLAIDQAGSVTGQLRDPDSESSEESEIDESDLLADANQNELTNQLAAAGTVGVAAAAAVTTVRKRGRNKWEFETNPAVRKRQQTRLLRRLRATLDEMQARVGQQCVVLTASPGKAVSTNTFKCFGASPLDDVIRGHQDGIMRDLETSLERHVSTAQVPDPDKHELPPLVIEGIPTPLNKMTQAQLRAFIPLMLKYSTGRPKPGWGKDDMRPVWWPDGLPWQNVRADMRSDNEKQQTQWTEALRQIVRNCYTHHNRLDLLLETAEDPLDQLRAEQHGELDLQQIPGLPEQTQVILDLAQHPQLIQHIQAADGTAMLLPQYLDGQMVISLATDTGQVGVDPQVVATIAVSSATGGVHTVANTTAAITDSCDPILAEQVNVASDS